MGRRSEITFLTGAPPREKVRSWLARPWARSAAFSARARRLARPFSPLAGEHARQGEVAEDAGEEVVEVVGDPARQQGQRFELLGTDHLPLPAFPLRLELALHPLALRDVAHHGDDPQRPVPLEGARDHLHLDDGLVEAHHPVLGGGHHPRPVVELGVAGFHQGDVLGEEEVPHRQADDLLRPPGPQDGHRGGVGEDEAACLVDQNPQRRGVKDREQVLLRLAPPVYLLGELRTLLPETILQLVDGPRQLPDAGRRHYRVPFQCRSTEVGLDPGGRAMVSATALVAMSTT